MDKDTALIHFALDAGELMIRNGAETFRVQDTMYRILSVSGEEKAEALALVTLLLVTLPRENDSPLSMMRAIHTRSTNFQKVCAINDISRDFVEGSISLAQAQRRLTLAEQEGGFSPFLQILGFGTISGCFSFLGTLILLDGTISFFIGIFLGILLQFLKNRKTPYFLPPFLCGSFVALLAGSIDFLIPASQIDHIIIGGIMPLLPGVTFAKSMRDLMEGNIISGYTKIVEALVIAASLAGGVGLTLNYFL